MNEISRRSLSGGGMSLTRTETPMSDPAGNLVAYNGVLFEIRDNDLDGLYTQRIATDGQIRLRLEKTGDDPNGANTVHHLSVYLVFYSANAGLLTEQARIELTLYENLGMLILRDDGGKP